MIDRVEHYLTLVDRIRNGLIAALMAVCGFEFSPYIEYIEQHDRFFIVLFAGVGAFASLVFSYLSYRLKRRIAIATGKLP